MALACGTDEKKESSGQSAHAACCFLDCRTVCSPLPSRIPSPVYLHVSVVFASEAEISVVTVRLVGGGLALVCPGRMASSRSKCKNDAVTRVACTVPGVANGRPDRSSRIFARRVIEVLSGDPRACLVSSAAAFRLPPGSHLCGAVLGCLFLENTPTANPSIQYIPRFRCCCLFEAAVQCSRMHFASRRGLCSAGPVGETVTVGSVKAVPAR